MVYYRILRENPVLEVKTRGQCSRMATESGRNDTKAVISSDASEALAGWLLH